MTITPLTTVCPMPVARTSNTPRPLNVGGQAFLASEQTFERCTRNQDGVFVHGEGAFIDRDGESFKHVIAHLRGRSLPPDLRSDELACLAQEASYFGMATLNAEIEALNLWNAMCANEDDPEWEKLHINDKAKAYLYRAHGLLEENSELGALAFYRALQFDPYGVAFREVYVDREYVKFTLEQMRLLEPFARVCACNISTSQRGAQPFDEAMSNAAVEAYEVGRNDLTAQEWRRVAYQLCPPLRSISEGERDPHSALGSASMKHIDAWKTFLARFNAASAEGSANHLVAAMLKFSEEDYAEALQHLQKASLDDPSNVAIRMVIQEVCAALQDFDASDEAYRAWAANRPGVQPVKGPMLFAAQVRLVQATQATEPATKAAALSKARAAYEEYMQAAQRRDVNVEKAIAYLERP